MYYSERILLAELDGEDENGYCTSLPAPSMREVWADCHSVTRAEYYAANADGNKTLLSFAVHAEDYRNEPSVIFGGRRYDVIRAYRKGLGSVELTCSDRGIYDGEGIL